MEYVEVHEKAAKDFSGQVSDIPLDYEDEPEEEEPEPDRADDSQWFTGQ